MAASAGLPVSYAPLVDPKTGIITRAWYLPILSLFRPLPESAVSVGASPFAFTATQGGNLLISGGTVSQISVRRNQTFVTGLTSGFIPVSSGDVVTITYAVAPTLEFFPR